VKEIDWRTTMPSKISILLWHAGILLGLHKRRIAEIALSVP